MLEVVVLFDMLSQSEEAVGANLLAYSSPVCWHMAEGEERTAAASLPFIYAAFCAP